MRIIAGQHKGRRLISPKGDHIRPALDQVKEAIFNILFDVTDFNVLDLFAGTGNLGIEALSRGAAHCTFVDNHREALQIIKKNLALCNFIEKSTLLPLVTPKAIELLEEKNEIFDLIFCDPPYERGWIRKSLAKLETASFVGPKTILCLEHHPKEPIPPFKGLILTDSRKYGQTLVSFLRKKE